MNQTAHPFLDAPDLQWRDSLPVSGEFDDPYYSKDDGLEETRHVFINGTQLAEEMARQSQANTFCIFETGFGTGLNFLATLELWRQTPGENRPERLRFMSVESRPLNKGDIDRALAPWRDQLAGIDHLVANFPPRLAGHYRIDFGDVELTLLFDDIKTSLEQLVVPEQSFDVLYLDGFAPARNPDMWSYSVFESLARLLKPGATAATFTAAGVVRRGLEKAGFTVNRVPGFGSKRDMTIARRSTEPGSEPRMREPWFAQPASPKPQKIAVVGAGLAGAAVARAASDQNIEVVVYEAGTDAAGQTSAVPHAGWHPHFTVDFNLRSQLMLHGHLATLNALDRHGLRESNWVDECGFYFAADREDRVERLSSIAQRLDHAGLDVRFVDVDAAKAATGVAVQSPGLVSDLGGCISPRLLCENLLGDIDTRYNTSVQTLEPSPAGGWSVNGERYDAVVLCTGGADSLSQGFGDFRINRVRGQVDVIPHCAALDNQQRLICFKGYLTRAGVDGYHVTGATFDDDNEDAATTQAAHSINRDRLRNLLPQIGAELDQAPPTGWVGWRRASHDRLPVVGSVPNLDWYADTYRPWTRGGAPGPAPTPVYRDGLYVSLGHGARGTSTAVISGEIIAAMLAGNPLPVPARLVHALHPARFVIRDLKRGPAYQD